jgi:hypothetical protein
MLMRDAAAGEAGSDASPDPRIAAPRSQRMVGMIGTLLAGGLLVAASAGETASRERADETLRVVLPRGWTLEGAEGEYRLESEGSAMASLLLLAPDSERSLEERLADIEEQFLSTGIIRLEASETRTEDREPVRYRRYRLIPAGSEEEARILHQYWFDRAGVEVLLQVEDAPGRFPPDDLAFRIFHTLEIRRAPPPFRWEDPAR